MTKLNSINTNMTNQQYDSAYIIKKGKMRVGLADKNVIKIELNSLSANRNNSVHYINLVDTSSSMEDAMGSLKKALKEFARGIEQKDRLSVIQFNSPGSSKALFTELQINTNNLTKYDSVVNGLDACGCTCFSEPLQRVNDIIDQSHVRDYLCVSIVTDGCPEGHFDKEKEIEKSLKIAKVLGVDVTAINTIGFGEYCDVKFLKSLSAESQLGKYIHIDDINDIKTIWNKTFKEMKSYVNNSLNISTTGEILYDSDYKTLLSNNSINLDYVNGDTNTVYIVLEDGETHFTINGKNYSIDDVGHTMSDNDLSNLGLKWSRELHYEGNKDKAIEVLNSCNRSDIAEKLQGALLQKEIKQVYENIESNITQVDVPQQEGFNLLSLLDTLKGNSYIDIKTLSNYVSNSIKDERDNVRRVPKEYSEFNGYTFNSLGTNLNIAFKHKVELGFEAEELERAKLNGILGNVIVVDSIKNYSVVKNGEYHIGKLIMHVKTDVLGDILGLLCKTTMPFKIIEYIKESSITDCKKVCFNIEQLPMTGTISNDKFGYIYNRYLDLCNHKAIAKVLKYYIKLVSGLFVNNFSDLDSLQIDFLKSNGLDSKMHYSEKVTSKSNTSVKSGITFSIKGSASIPSVESLVAIYKSNKTSTKFYDSTMIEVIQDCEYDLRHKTNQECIESWNNLLDFSNSRIAYLESVVNKDKFERFVSGSYWCDCDGEYGSYPTVKVQIIPKTEKRLAI